MSVLLLACVVQLAGLSGSAQAEPEQQDVARAPDGKCGASARGGFIGLHGGESFTNPGQRECILAKQGSSGGAVMRHVFEWSSIETLPGVYDWKLYDEWMTTIARKRIRVLAMLFKAPALYAPASETGSYPPRDPNALASFATAAVKRYGPRGTFWAEHPEVPKRPISSWQIWNEPNLKQYWLPRPSISGYAKMLRVVSIAIRRQDPKAEIVTAGMPATKLPDAIPFDRFVSGLYRAGAKAHFSTLAPNAYGTNGKAVLKSMRAVRRLMNRFGHRKGNIWITEIGFGTAGPRHRFNIGPKRQATEIGRLFKGLYRERRRLKLRGIVYFGWQDLPPYPPRFKDAWGLHTGLFTVSGKPKPSYYVFNRVAPTLR